jgi:hypothetical protein
VSGDVFSPEEILRAHPDVFVLDLSQVGREGLRRATQAALRIGARLIALASMPDPADERVVTGAGGLYRLKSAGADGLAEIVQAMARQRVELAPATRDAGRHECDALTGGRSSRA